MRFLIGLFTGAAVTFAAAGFIKPQPPYFEKTISSWLSQVREVVTDTPALPQLPQPQGPGGDIVEPELAEVVPHETPLDQPPTIPAQPQAAVPEAVQQPVPVPDSLTESPDNGPAEAMEELVMEELVDESQFSGRGKPQEATVWAPFYSRASAEGFARRLTETLAQPFEVRRRAAARYEVVYVHQHPQQWADVQQRIDVMFGSR